MDIRIALEEREESLLMPEASLSRESKGREFFEEPCPYRTDYQRDRDRIIHSKAFRRLKDKTQVFISPEGDHYRTRLTHTLEVTQIARSAARALNLNEDLTEAIALGHDLGHTPFGHTGEEALDEVVSTGFKHNDQSLRVVELLEKRNTRYRGLNLTYEVRNGILCHTGEKSPETLEGQIVRLADKIAYVNHDAEDALRAGIIQEGDLPKEAKLLGRNSSARINTLVRGLVDHSYGKKEVSLPDELLNLLMEFRRYLFANVYIGSSAKTQESKAQNLLKMLFYYYLENPKELLKNTKSTDDDSDIERLACDYIAGMTDRFAVHEFSKHFIPNPWNAF
ncbi:MAG: deoxyguanosinetriphosphate triphosphohydrolase [Firmicutes bacterium]|nr:deoxyguanosinetriphosphate triphosphohydrolase [Bacillota bacterium]MDD4263671.1 deoxyguanosinetriphosphate triphosphohydrolase [Bacillota bacterium]MDD4694345.1 deoxyguanosinetriphosphate triphosphohydrolase [Bacillota bacterium]